MDLVFEWDEINASANLHKHRISFEEAETAFDDPDSITILDPQHSQDEDRFVTIGRAINGQLIVVVYTERGTHIRLISARKATAQERKQYEQP